MSNSFGFGGTNASVVFRAVLRGPAWRTHTGEAEAARAAKKGSETSGDPTLTPALSRARESGFPNSRRSLVSRPPRARGRGLGWELGVGMRRLLATLVVLLACGAGLGFYAQRALHAPGPLAEARNVVVPRGGFRSVAEGLAQSGVIENPTAFLIAAWATRGEGNLHAAELAFPPHASLRQVLTILRTARPVRHLFVIREGLTSKQIAAQLAAAEAMTGAAPPPPEGSVLPETYAYEYGAERSAVLARARAGMDRALAEAWAERAPNLPLTSPKQALVLASIIERETSRPEERARVAAVYINRLRRGMKLQADPTVVYAVSDGAGVLNRPLSRADLDRDDPYNTYRFAGLPPGPIDLPGLASIIAAIQPADTDELYFVADGQGGHVFARTLEEHQRNVVRWRSLSAPPPPG